MFEFHYAVSLEVVHPSADPDAITAAIAEFKATQSTKAGAKRLKADGAPIVPERGASRTYWTARLHDEERIHSGDIPLNDFVASIVPKLFRHRDLFLELGMQGTVRLHVRWFGDTNCSASWLGAEALRACGEL